MAGSVVAGADLPGRLASPRGGGSDPAGEHDPDGAEQDLQVEHR